MRRLKNIFLINHPEGLSSVPQAFVANGWLGGKALRDVGREEPPLERTSQRVYPGDEPYRLKPLGR
jgi:hypothetical protein